MKISKDMKATYGKSTNRPNWNEEFDFLLYRQDFDGSESIYFNVEELKDIDNKIMDGKIVIHPNYSLIYAKNDKLLKRCKSIPCYGVVWNV